MQIEIYLRNLVKQIPDIVYPKSFQNVAAKNVSFPIVIHNAININLVL